MQALRDVMHDLYPTLLGYAKVYDSSKYFGNLKKPKNIKPKLRPAYQSNLKRNKKPKIHQDAIYYTLLHRLYQEKGPRKEGGTSDKDDSKHRTPTQVCFTKL